VNSAVRQQHFPELELGLYRLHSDSYQVELRFTDSDPDNQAEIAPQRLPAALDLQQLLTLQHDPGHYGATLAEQLFSDEQIRLAWAQVKTAVESREQPLRLRLLIGPGTPELHSVRWELLRDPQTGATLATSQKILFSRFMLSQDWRPLRLRPKTELSALVAISAPHNLANYQLAAVDLPAQLAMVREQLASIDLHIIGRDQPLTLDNLLAGLRTGPDILYLVCHGALTRQGVPILYLQDESAAVKVIKGDDLALRITELTQPPRLAVLASCDSAAVHAASPDTADVESSAQLSHTALAPRLAEAGVPAVLAMQGQISMATVAKAMPIFFSELLKDGQIDRALAVARGTVREQNDSWMPALFLRLKRGRIWYVPGFTGGGEDFKKWKSLCSHVRQGSFIPILGTDVGEHVFGPQQEIAEQLSQLHGFPLAAHDRSDLTKVAQYLSVDQSRQYAREAVVEQLHQRLRARYPQLAGGSDKSFSLPKLLDALVERQPQDDPLRILAALPAALYVNASADPLLLKTLKAAGREPVPLLCDWRPTADNHPREPVYDAEPDRQHPVVYHVFGVLGKPNSLVLTEDDFFDYLIATAEYKLIPTAVRGALTRSSLLFLGFHLDDWTFRVLFRLIMSLGGNRQLREYAHVGVQVDPEDHSLADIERARSYLEEYFGAGGDAPPISIYWGSVADFLSELRDQLAAHADDDAVVSVAEDEDEWIS
jgi:hypothetical protein